MDSSEKQIICGLCFEFKVKLFEFSILAEKIEKYLKIKMEFDESQLCWDCSNSIENFHKFYEKVHAAQKNYSNYLINKKKELDIKFTETKNYLNCNDNPTNSFLQKEENENIVPNKNKCNGTKKSKMSKLKTIIDETETKMLEFYNIKCEKCEDNNFSSFKMLNKHYISIHNTQGYIKCCKRNIRVNDKYYLRNHMLKHLQPETCRCGICGKELSSSATLKHHMILHRPNEERPFQCNSCDKKFCCKNDLKNHEKVVHVSENKREDYICDVCGKVFQKVANLRYHHSTVHLQEKKYICEVCAKCFTTQSGLRTHINAAHTALDPIQCTECNKWLKTKDTYQKHLQLHQNNTHPCPHCVKVCNSSASLRSHLVKHSKDRPHKCTICRKSFKTKTHLKNHSSQHSAGTNFKCPYCCKQFVNISNYYTHRRRMHSTEMAKKFSELESFHVSKSVTVRNESENQNLEPQNTSSRKMNEVSVTTPQYVIKFCQTVKNHNQS